MAFDFKYGRVEAENGGSLNDSDEPVFVIRAQDVCAPEAVRRWSEEAFAAGASSEVLEQARGVANAMDAWQAAHPDRVKVAD